MSRLKKFLKLLGPGFITGASDDDPSGIGTYAQTGARLGFHQLWLPLFTFPFMAVVQEMCGRIGMVTGRGLAAVIRKNYARPILYFSVFLLVAANTINIGADLGAMAASAQLLFDPIPFAAWLLAFTSITLLLIIFVPYKTYAKFLKWLTLSLFAYVAVAFAVEQDWTEVMRSAVTPTFSWDKNFVLNMVAVLGTTISPYLFFWQADEEVEEEIVKRQLSPTGNGSPKINIRDIGRMRWDTVLGMFFSNFIMFFVILAAASTLFANGLFEIQTADDAARALEPIAGSFASMLFAFGIVGTGLLAVPILAGSASYAVSEALGWRAGLSKTFGQARGFYGVIVVATLVGLFVNFLGIPPFTMLYYTAVINGIAAPPLLILILLISANKRIMRRYTNHPLSTLLGWCIAFLMTSAAIALLFLS